jgi:hypothetical protein
VAVHTINNAYVYAQFIQSQEFKRLGAESQRIMKDLFDAAEKSDVAVQDVAKIILGEMTIDDALNSTGEQDGVAVCR